LLFFSRQRRPRSSTLFPYTTLFRSVLTENDLAHLRRCVELAEEALEAGDEPFGSVLVGPDHKVLAEDRNRIAETGDPTQHPEFKDRKSTRLNSSHVKISYAVFCLKK